MTDHLQTYHPYRFQRISEALRDRAKRVQGLAMTPQGFNAEYDGMSEDEFTSRLRYQRRVTEVRKQWAIHGRQVFDMSSILAPLAGASDIEISGTALLEFPDAFYLHFGSGAEITVDELDYYVDGTYFVRSADSENPGFEFVVVATRGNVLLAGATTGTLLREQTAVAIGFSPAEGPFRASLAPMIGDRIFGGGDLIERVIERLELCLNLSTAWADPDDPSGLSPLYGAPQIAGNQP